MSALTVTPAPAGHTRFTHIIKDGITSEGVALVYAERDESKGADYYVEMATGRGRSVRTLEDAKTFAAMNLSGEWDAVSAGDKKGPFDY